MNRFSLEEKLEAVLKYLEGKVSYNTIAKSIGVNKKAVRIWVALYQAHGMEALKHRSCLYYSEMFKLEVIQYMYEHGASYFETAVHFNIASPYTISKWEKAMHSGGKDASRLPNKGRSTMNKKANTPRNNHQENLSDKQRIKELEQKLADTEMENAYLKKLHALVQNKQMKK